MKYILSLLFVFLWITGAAQETCSRNYRPGYACRYREIQGYILAEI